MVFNVTQQYIVVGLGIWCLMSLSTTYSCRVRDMVFNVESDIKHHILTLQLYIVESDIKHHIPNPTTIYC
jgi:hypothetical protein